MPCKRASPWIRQLSQSRMVKLLWKNLLVKPQDHTATFAGAQSGRFTTSYLCNLDFWKGSWKQQTTQMLAMSSSEAWACYNYRSGWATLFLEEDGLLVFSCYEKLSTIVEFQTSPMFALLQRQSNTQMRTLQNLSGELRRTLTQQFIGLFNATRLMSPFSIQCLKPMETVESWERYYHEWSQSGAPCLLGCSRRCNCFN